MEVDGGRIYTEVAGDGPPLLLGHAGIVDLRMWDGVWEPLAERRRVVRYDMRGWGRSSTPTGPWSPRDDIAAVLDHHGVDRAAVCSISYGGRTVLDFALERPERVSALVLVACGAAGRPPPAPEVSAPMEEADAVGEAGDVDRAVDLEIGIWVDGPTRGPDEVEASVRERVREMNLIAWRQALAAEGEPIPLEPVAYGRLGEISVPTLVVAGGLDVPWINEGCEQLAEGIPGARLEVVPDAAHMVPMERPDAFVRLLERFLPAP